MKTLQLGLNWFYDRPGGLDRIYEGLLRHLPDAGVEVQGLVTGPSEVSDRTSGRAQSFAASGAALPHRLMAARAATSKALASGTIDLVASHFALYTIPSIDKMRRKPLAVHFHGPWGEEAGAEGEKSIAQRVKRSIEAAVYKNARRFIVLSSPFGQILTKSYGVAEELIRVVPGGIDPERYAVDISRREARVQLGWPQDRPIVLSVRRLARRMGLNTLIDAAANLRRTVPDVLIVVAGRGDLEPELRQTIAERGLEHHVRLIGFVPDDLLPLAYRGADISIVPSVSLEGFGLTTIESLASGTPVLVTPVGGLPDAVRDLSAELVLETASAECLADALGGALTGRRALPSAESCQDYVRERFSWPIIAQRIRGVYEEALS